jgi:hypothetical protein
MLAEQLPPGNPFLCDHRLGPKPPRSETRAEPRSSRTSQRRQNLPDRQRIRAGRHSHRRTAKDDLDHRRCRRRTGRGRCRVNRIASFRNCDRHKGPDRRLAEFAAPILRPPLKQLVPVQLAPSRQLRDRRPRREALDHDRQLLVDRPASAPAVPGQNLETAKPGVRGNIIPDMMADTSHDLASLLSEDATVPLSQRRGKVRLP